MIVRIHDKDFPKTVTYPASLEKLMHSLTPGMMTPLIDIRDNVCTIHGCRSYNGNCHLCNDQAGGCYGHISDKTFDQEVNTVIAEIEVLNAS